MLLWKVLRPEISLCASIRSARRISLGKGVRIERGCRIQGPEDGGGILSIGNRCVFRNDAYVSARFGVLIISDYCYFAHRTWLGGRGKIFIGENAIFGPNVVIISSNHDLNCDSVPRFDFPEIASEIHIGSNVWVGANSVILPGSTIGENSIIGAGSVVSGQIGSNCLAWGNPTSVKKILHSRAERQISKLGIG